ncbi:Polysaccharide biosynthesis protein [compost metagenome]
MSLLSRALGAAAWGYAGTFLKFVLQFGVQSILARALGPEAFGIFAAGVVVVSFAIFFGDVASSALILQAEVRAKEVRFAFTWQLMVGSLAALVIYFAAPTIAKLSVGENAVFAIRVLSLICIFSAFGGVSCALLRKSLSFKKIQISQIAGYVAGYVLVGLPYGLLYNANENALVFAWVVQALVTSILYYCFSRHSLRPLILCENGLSLVRFSVNSFWANFGTWAINNVDRMVVSHRFSPMVLGYYSNSANLLISPLNQFFGTFQQIAFSAGAKMGGGTLGLMKAFSSTLALGSVSIAAFYAITFGAAKEIILIVYGPKWVGVVPVFQVFCVAFTFWAVGSLITPFLWASGAIKRDARTQILMALFLSGASYSAAQYGIKAVAIAVSCVFAVRAILLLRVSLNLFSLSLLSILRLSISTAAYFWLISTAVTWIFKSSLDGLTNMQNAVVVAVLFVCGILAPFLLPSFFGRVFSDAVLGVSGAVSQGWTSYCRKRRAAVHLK